MQHSLQAHPSVSRVLALELRSPGRLRMKYDGNKADNLAGVSRSSETGQAEDTHGVQSNR
jgi:hypothetical protein